MSEPIEEQLPTEVRFDVLKSGQHRVIHVDGAWGGLTGRGGIHMTLYSERGAIPRRLVYSVTEAGALGEELVERRESRDALIREAEVTAIMDQRTAQALKVWLEEKLEAMERLRSEAPSDAEHPIPDNDAG